MSNSAITLENVTFRYPESSNPSVRNISLTVNSGECVVVTGASGCGKTTITRIINGLAHDFYEGELTGSVFVGGHEIRSMTSWERSDLIGSVFQNPRTQFFNLDTTGEVVFGMENLAVEHAEMHCRYHQVVQDLSISKLMNRNIFHLSGGEKQAIAFASAWANEPEVYVLDEPSSNLDIPAMQHLSEFVAKAKANGAAVIIAEHRLFWLADIADYFVYIADGEIIESWSSDEFINLDKPAREQRGLRSLEQSDYAHLANKRPDVDRPYACEMRGVEFAYKNGTCFAQPDFAVDYGEVVGIVGKNGCGKTTTLRCLCGLHKEISGQVLFDGCEVIPRKRAEHSFLVMQDCDYQLFRTSVFAELEKAAKRGGKSLEEIPTLLKQLNLSQFQKRHPASLSGGQKQRVVCAMAALSSSDVVLFDEPTSGLDYINMVRLALLVRQFAAKGKAVVVVSHDAEFLLQACDRVVRFE